METQALNTTRLTGRPLPLRFEIHLKCLIRHPKKSPSDAAGGRSSELSEPHPVCRLGERQPSGCRGHLIDTGVLAVIRLHLLGNSTYGQRVEAFIVCVVLLRLVRIFD